MDQQPPLRRLGAVPALHEQDLARLIGSESVAKWACSECGEEGTGIAAGYVKQDQGLRPICFKCFLLGTGIRYER